MGNRTAHNRVPLDGLRALATPFAEEFDADIAVYSGELMPRADSLVVKRVRGARSRKNVLLFLSTEGGSADAAYRIARCLKNKYDRFTLYVDSYCKSAGTLIAIAADEIVMSDEAELGPLDVQLAKPDELAEWTSGLTPIQALTTLRQQAFRTFEDCFLQLRYKSGLTITTKTALEIAGKLVVGWFAPIYKQLDPMRLGEIQRAMSIALQYGGRLAGDNLKEDALEHLIADYPSHGFIIDRKEAGELFENVREPNQKETLLAHGVQEFLAENVDEDEVFADFASSPRKPSADGGKKEMANETKSKNRAQAASGKSSIGRARTARTGKQEPVGATPSADGASSKPRK